MWSCDDPCSCVGATTVPVPVPMPVSVPVLQPDASLDVLTVFGVYDEKIRRNMCDLPLTVPFLHKGVHGDMHPSKEWAGWTWHPRIHARCSVHVQSVVVTFLHLAERLRCHQPGRQLRSTAAKLPAIPKEVACHMPCVHER